MGSRINQRSIKILNEDTTSIIKIAVSREGSYFDQRSTTVYLLRGCLDIIWHSVAEMQWETMLYRTLQCGQRNAVRISKAGRHANRAHSAIDSRSEEPTFGYRFRNLIAPASKLAYEYEAGVQRVC